MKAKEYLKQYEELNRIAKRYKAEYQLEIERIDAIGSTLAGEPGMPHGTGVSRKTEDKAIRLADKALKWKAAELDAIEKRQEIFELISDVKGVEGEVLYERYINLRHWEEICVLIHYSWVQTHEYHKRALRIIQDRIEPNI
ncbi:MAG: hypothetical protein IIY21_07665 [Clostridiales bacterium]|nr:hypothetical protein [Clostridiales bacterium]